MFLQRTIRFTVVMILVLSLAFSGCSGTDDVQEESADALDDESLGTMDDVADRTDEDTMVSELTVTSPVFDNAGTIPVTYTCDGEDINPDIHITGVPAEAASLLLIMDDPDAPMGTFTHWVVWNIPADSQIDKDSVPGIEGQNSAGQVSYIGPCPPSGTHRYFFKVYALDMELDIESGSERALVEDTMSGHVVAYGELMGTYSRL